MDDAAAIDRVSEFRRISTRVYVDFSEKRLLPVPGRTSAAAGNIGRTGCHRENLLHNDLKSLTCSHCTRTYALHVAYIFIIEEMRVTRLKSFYKTKYY